MSIMAMRGVMTRLIGGDPANAIGGTNKTTRITTVLFTIAPHLFPAKTSRGLAKVKTGFGATEATCA
jgi:hypothetical protein